MKTTLARHGLRALTLAAGLFALTEPLFAQTLYGLDTGGGVALPRVIEATGPAAGPCAYPNGPLGLPPFPTVPGACPTPGPFPGFPTLQGDVAINKKTNTVWAAGPFEVAEYDVFGTFLSGFATPLPGALTSAGMDSATGMLWLSNGIEYVGVFPGCPAPTVAMGPFPVPIGAIMTDITVDSTDGTLWACFDDGRVAHFPPGGAPFCVFSALPVGLGLPLTGIAFDSTTPGLTVGTKTLYITDGPMIARINASITCGTGVTTAAAPTFPFPVPGPIWPAPTGPLSGLAFAAHGVTFGTGTGPTIRFSGHSVVPGAANTLELAGAAPGTAAVFIDFAGLCPPGAFKGLPLFVMPGLLIGPFPHGGSLSLPASLPAGVPIGSEIYMQWWNRTATGAWENTPGLVITASLL